MAVSVENVDKTIARTRHIVVFLRILFGIGDEEVTVNVLDTEGREPSRNVRICKAAVDLRRGRRPEAGRAIRGEYVDRSGPEVGRKEKDAVHVGAEHQTFIDRVRRVVDGE